MIDLRVKARPDLEPDHLATARERLQQAYPIAEEQRRAENVLRLSLSQPAVSGELRDHGFQGYLLRSEDRLVAVQLRVDGFTFNRLRPYTSWEDILPKALEAWTVYREVVAPEFVGRLALRYINHIPVPFEDPGFDLDDYLECAPRIPKTLPQVLSGFMTQVVVQDEERDLAAVIRQSLEANLKEKQVGVLLDIDTYHLAELEADAPEIEGTLDRLRTLKNRIFFGSLTDKAVELFE